MNKKNSSIVRILIIVAVLLSGCGGSGVLTASSTGLHAWLDQAPDGALIPLAPFTLTAHARNAGNGGVVSLEFMVDGVSVGIVPTDPDLPLVVASLDWDPPANGEYNIQAVAHSGSSRAYSETARVCVQAGVQPRMGYGICDPSLAVPNTPTSTPTPTVTSTSTPTSTASPTHTLAPIVPVPPASPGALAGRVFFDNNANGFFDAGDEGQSVYKLSLYQNGNCTGSATLGASPDAGGNYAFADLPAGTWCVSLAYSGSSVLPGGAQTAAVIAGKTTIVNFAIQPPE